MADRMALKTAIDLMHMPSRVWAVRSQPLPPGVSTLLCIAAGEGGAESSAITSTGRSRDVIQKAAGFFIEQVLLCPNADSYRVLGATSEATNAELRRNMALLMRWLHPDMDPEGRRSVFASRVTLAWNDLKTPERRAAYDRQRPSSPAKAPRARSSRPSDRHRHGRRTVSRLHATHGRNLLSRIVAWMSSLAQLRPR